MSTKYLGEVFDIHGGGMDLMFPHHECEIAQSVAGQGREAVRYWMHNNMITINGQKMARSLGNFITLDQLFSGKHPVLTQAYNPMTIRFFILQAQYRGTVDFSNEALLAAEKGLQRLTNAFAALPKVPASATSSANIAALEAKCYEAMNDDLNTPIVIAQLFELARIIHAAIGGTETLTADDKALTAKLFDTFLIGILGLKPAENSVNSQLTGELIDLLLTLRLEAKKNKNFALSDDIRNRLTEKGVRVKDTKEGFEWSI